jgi:hypothetical protein
MTEESEELQLLGRELAIAKERTRAAEAEAATAKAELDLLNCKSVHVRR